MDAYKASEMISVMLEGLKKKCTQAAAKQSTFPFLPTDPSFLPQQDDSKLEQNAAMTLGMMSGGVVAPNAFDQTMGGNNSGLSAPGLDQGVISAPSPFSMFGPGATMETPPANLDWDAWDSYIQNTNFDPSGQFWPMPMDMPPVEQQNDQFQNGTLDGGGGVGPFMGINSPSNNL